MKFAKVIDGVIEEYKDFPSQPECKYINGLPTIRPVVELAKPAYDPVTHALQRVDVIQNDRVEWSWVPVALPPDQVVINKRNIEDTTARTEVKADTFVQNFIAMSPAQVRNYVDSNVTDLASARAMLKRLAVIVLLLAKREYRD